MNYSKDEVIQYAREEDVKFIRLAFCDVFGKQKNISIMPDELPRAFEYGIAFDGFAVAGDEAGYMDIAPEDHGENVRREAFFSCMIAGVLANIRAMTAFLDPSEGSYQRLGSCKAPGYIS